MSDSRSYYASKFESELIDPKQRHILSDRGPSTAACPQLLGDEDKGIEKGEEKNILYWAYL